jgi:hypothetical protein
VGVRRASAGGAIHGTDFGDALSRGAGVPESRGAYYKKELRAIFNPQPYPQNELPYATSAYFGTPRGPVKSVKSLSPERCHGRGPRKMQLTFQQSDCPAQAAKFELSAESNVPREGIHAHLENASLHGTFHVSSLSATATPIPVKSQPYSARNNSW